MNVTIGVCTFNRAASLRRTLDSIKPRSGESFRQVEADGAGHLIADLLEPLLDIPTSEWTFDQIVYEVVAR